jgi:hypothetical protein
MRVVRGRTERSIPLTPSHRVRTAQPERNQRENPRLHTAWRLPRQNAHRQPQRKKKKKMAVSTQNIDWLFLQVCSITRIRFQPNSVAILTLLLARDSEYIYRASSLQCEFLFPTSHLSTRVSVEVCARKSPPASQSFQSSQSLQPRCFYFLSKTQSNFISISTRSFIAINKSFDMENQTGSRGCFNCES